MKLANIKPRKEGLQSVVDIEHDFLIVKSEHNISIVDCETLNFKYNGDFIHNLFSAGFVCRIKVTFAAIKYIWGK
jgi:hypothetical protein